MKDAKKALSNKLLDCIGQLKIFCFRHQEHERDRRRCREYAVYYERERKPIKIALNIKIRNIYLFMISTPC